MSGNVISEIVQHGFCIGCGVCAALCPVENLKIVWNKFGEYQPVDTGKCLGKCDLCLQICPRFGKNKNQFEIAQDQFKSTPGIQFEKVTGFYLECFVGSSKDYELRNQAASGGLCTLFLKSLLDSNRVDGVICVQPVNDPERLFEFFIAKTYEQLYAAASSVYYPVEMSAVIREIMEQDDARYAIVGLPCFLTSISLAQEKSPKLKRIIKYKVGLVCGSLPNRTFNEKILSRIRIPLNCIQSIKFRDTEVYPNRLRGMKFTDITGKVCRAFNASEAGIRRSGRFIYTACLFCSDIFAETADAVFMDAWLPEYQNDHFGSSLVLSRNQDVNEVIGEIGENGLADIDFTSIEKIIASQKPRINNKRPGLSYRVELCRAWGIRFPENLHVGKYSELAAGQKKKISLKFAEHLSFHGNRQVTEKIVRQALPSMIVKKLSEIKADCKDIVRKYYFTYKYSRKR